LSSFQLLLQYLELLNFLILIDILDEACSRINLNNKELYQLEVLKNQLKDVQEEKEEAASS